EILDQHVRPGGELAHDALPPPALEIDGDRALAAVARMIIRAGQFAAVLGRHERRPHPRVSSPAPARSTLITSAPSSARIWPAHGPARMRASSSTRSFLIDPGMIGLQGRAPRRAAAAAERLCRLPEPSCPDHRCRNAWLNDMTRGPIRESRAVRAVVGII